jgi:4-alpha-glucanotransferase
MPAPRTPSIRRLADAADVVVDWVDAWGEPQVVAYEDLLAVLSALLGRPLESEAEVEDATRELGAYRPVIEPVIVAWDGELTPIEVGAPVREAAIELEDGTEEPVDVSGGLITARRRLPIGYHTLHVDGGAHRSHVVSAPRTAHPAPTGELGVISPLYSLHRDGGDRGIGNLRDLASLADLCDEVGVAVVGTLPLLATFPDQPSPYAPASRRAWNELFIDLERVPDWSPGALAAPSDGEWVDYDGTGAAIRSELARYSEHVASTPGLRAEVDRFLDGDPEMRRYAMFRATADRHGRNWRAWPDDALPDPSRILYHETVQWLMDMQLRQLSRSMSDRGQYLYLDLPIGCNPDGYDIWDTPDLFAAASLGAPPDTLFVGGQDWGLPASIPARSREEGHANFRKAIGRQLSVAGLLRIDHVMGIHRTWWVPHGRPATRGAYVMQPTEEMFAIICIESVRAGAGVVGENLGTVPPEIRSGLDEHELLGMAMADGATDPRPNDLIALSSHDTPAFAAWWKGNDIEDLLDLDVFDTQRAEAERQARRRAVDGLEDAFGTSGAESTRDALMEWMAGTPAAVALLNLDDLIMEERRQNIPGTDWERPNWRLRHVPSLSDLWADEEFMQRLRRFAAARPSGGGS